MENKKLQDILVYTDFTEVGEKAVNWGIFLATNLKVGLFVLYVINENSPEKEEEKQNVFAAENLEEIKVSIKQKHNLNIKTNYEKGCTCTIINSTAERIDALFVIAGFHALNDLQYLSGTSLVKIIRKARIPYLCIPKNAQEPSLNKKLLFPINGLKEAKEKVGWATYFSSKLNLKLQIVLPRSQDEIKTNLKFTKKFFNNYKLDFSELYVDKSHLVISKATLKLADLNEDLFMLALTTKESSIFNNIFGYKEGKLIANKNNLPVLLVNPRKDLYIPCI